MDFTTEMGDVGSSTLPHQKGRRMEESMADEMKEMRKMKAAGKKSASSKKKSGGGRKMGSSCR